MKEIDILQSPAAPLDGSRMARLRQWGATARSYAGDRARGPATVFSVRQRLLLLAAVALLLVLRVPLAWWHGRFLGEEGSIFMAFAWHRPAGLALWRSFAGYLNLGANASTLAMVELVRAGLLPLEQAPHFTMAVALLFQLLPAALILTGQGRWLANRWAVIGCLLFMAISPVTEEVFANVLHIQFHLALATALILALDIPDDRIKQLACWVPLLLAPLCGPGAIVLLPLFALRCLVDRRWPRLMQTLVLAGASAVQMALFYTRNPGRGHLLDPITLLNLMFVRFAATPILSAPLAKLLGKLVYRLYLGGGARWWGLAVVPLACFGWLIRTALRDIRDPAFWLIAAGLLVGSISFGAGMLLTDSSVWFNPSADQRYNFLPLTLLGMGLVALVRRGDPGYRGVVFPLCLLALVSGAVTYFIPIKMFRNGPDWHAEVATWRQDHDHRLATWPQKWLVDLSDHNRPCNPAIAIDNAHTEPGYCESSWRAIVAPPPPAN